MLLWFVGTAIAIVRFVFQDPRFDYRLLVVGAVLPLADGLMGGARVLHTLVFSLVVLAVVMVSTSRRGRLRPLLLGLPIGLLLHLVVDGAWTDTRLFWWPLGGFDLSGTELPEAARGWWAVADGAGRPGDPGVGVAVVAAVATGGAPSFLDDRAALRRTVRGAVEHSSPC